MPDMNVAFVDDNGHVLPNVIPAGMDRLVPGSNIEIDRSDPLAPVIRSSGGGGGGISATLIDARGDLIVGTADNTPARLARGLGGQVLTVDVGSPTGLSWQTPEAGVPGGGSGLDRIDFQIPGDLAVGLNSAVGMPLGAGWIRRIVATSAVTPGSGGLIVDVLAADGAATPLVFTSIFPTTGDRLNFGTNTVGANATPTDVRSYARSSVSPVAGWGERTVFRVGVSRVTGAPFAGPVGADLTVSLFFEAAV